MIKNNKKRIDLMINSFLFLLIIGINLIVLHYGGYYEDVDLSS